MRISRKNGACKFEAILHFCVLNLLAATACLLLPNPNLKKWSLNRAN
ncbi:MAG: hypothetical protein ACFN38_03670 [Campylobacter sp.]